jgi:hypothetical protein
MAFIFSNTIGGGASSGVPVSVSSNPDNFTITSLETTGAFTIPEKAIWVKIKNAGFVKDGDSNVDATIQGADWVPGREETWESFVDPSTGKTFKLPEITGNGNGARIFITYASM